MFFASSVLQWIFATTKKPIDFLLVFLLQQFSYCALHVIIQQRKENPLENSWVETVLMFPLPSYGEEEDVICLQLVAVGVFFSLRLFASNKSDARCLAAI